MEFPLLEDNIGGDDSAANATRASGSKRSFGDVEDDEGDIVGSKKGCRKVDEAAPGVATAMIVSLRESLQNCKDELASSKDELASCQDKLASCKDELASCKDELASCQNELEAAKTEVGEWKSAFQKESSLPAKKTTEPKFLIDYIQNFKSTEKSLKEQLEIAQMKLAIRDLKSQLEPESMKTDGDPEVDSEQQSQWTAALLDNLRAARAELKELKEVQAVELAELRKTQARHTKQMEFILQKFPNLVPPSAPAPEDANE